MKKGSSFLKITEAILLCLSFLLSGCLDEYAAPINQKTEQLVVESLLTNETLVPQIKLSTTLQFGSALEYKPVRGAFVKIIDNEGIETIFQQVSTQLGVYRIYDAAFKAVPGKSYKLTIKLTDGRTFESPSEKMPIPVEIDALSAKFENPSAEGKPGQMGYKVYAQLNDPQNTLNFYRWTTYSIYKKKSTGVPCFTNSICNERCWVQNNENPILLLSDNGVDGNKLTNLPVYFSPVYYYGKHYVEISQFNISKTTFQFWQRFNSQSVRSGTIFDPLPAPVLGNVINKNDKKDIALGYFEVSSISKKRLEIDGDTLVSKINFYRQYVPIGDCQLLFKRATADDNPVPGWN